MVAESAFADNPVTQQPITMEQLMRELRIQGGNFTFEFATPVYAQIKVLMVSEKGEEKIQLFDTAEAQKEIKLYFTVSNSFVGDYPKGAIANNMKKMLIKLSGCPETEGTRVMSYWDKFSSNEHQGGHGSLIPNLPESASLDEEYVLHRYYKEGDRYEVKATIQFTEQPPNSKEK